MISWMQKHNRYLVWTIWIATIAFIGAGFVGWGSYKFTLGDDDVAKVGSINIDKTQYEMAYKTIYNMYNEQLQGTLDEQKAKEYGIAKQAFGAVKTQALLLNMAKEYGIVADDTEVADALQGINGFQTNGNFDKSLYNQYLTSQGLKAKTFEDAIRNDLIIKKLEALLKTKSFDIENRAVMLPLDIEDELAITTLSPNDTTVSVNESDLQNYWNSNKNNYKNPEKFDVDVLWTSTDDIAISQSEIENFYNTKGGDYVGADGKKLPLAMMVPFITKELRIKKGEKVAQRAYIDFKKGKTKASQAITITTDDKSIDPEIIKDLQKAKSGDFLKPKVIGDKYATIKLVKATPPSLMSFDEAKTQVTQDFTKKLKEDSLQKIAQDKLKNINKTNAQNVFWLSVNDNKPIMSLDNQESLQFLQKLLTSKKERGIIKVSDKLIIFRILSQKIGQNEKINAAMMAQGVSQIKNSVLMKNIIDTLDKKYETKVYEKGMGFE